MNFSYCTNEDIKNIIIGQELKINGRYENLKREDGEEFPYVARKDDVVVVEKIKETYLVVRFFEDTVRLKTKDRENYGLFVIEPKHIQKFD